MSAERRKGTAVDGRHVFAIADGVLILDGERVAITRGQRFRADERLVLLRPDMFRTFTPPTVED